MVALGNKFAILIALCFIVNAKDIQEDVLKFFNKLNSQTAYPMADTFSTSRKSGTPELPNDISPSQYVNEQKALAYGLQLGGFSQALKDYGTNYQEYLAQKMLYEQQLLEEKMKALDVLRREQYVDDIKRLRSAYDLRDTNSIVTIDNTVGGRILTEPQDAYLKEPKAPLKNNIKPITHNDELNLLLQQRFNIDPTSSDNNDLHLLRNLRAEIAQNHDIIVKKGVRSFLQNVEIKRPTAQPALKQSCDICRSIDKLSLNGSWTLVLAYSPEVKRTAKTLLALKGPLINKNTLSCVGMKINSETFPSIVNATYKFSNGDYAQVTGIQTSNGDEFSIKSESYSNNYCIIYADKDYFVSTSTLQPNKCKSISVFAKLPATFMVTRFKVIDAIMKKLKIASVLPVSRIPHPDECIE